MNNQRPIIRASDFVIRHSFGDSDFVIVSSFGFRISSFNMLGITDYLWRLVPANPILLRVVETGGKRRRDLIIRCAYLGLLIFLVIFSLTSSNVGGASLAELAKTSVRVFQNLSYLQLALVALL